MDGVIVVQQSNQVAEERSGSERPSSPRPGRSNRSENDVNWSPSSESIAATKSNSVASKLSVQVRREMKLEDAGVDGKGYPEASRTTSRSLAAKPLDVQLDKLNGPASEPAGNDEPLTLYLGLSGWVEIDKNRPLAVLCSRGHNPVTIEPSVEEVTAVSRTTTATSNFPSKLELPPLKEKKSAPTAGATKKNGKTALSTKVNRTAKLKAAVAKSDLTRKSVSGPGGSTAIGGSSNPRKAGAKTAGAAAHPAVEVTSSIADWCKMMSATQMAHATKGKVVPGPKARKADAAVNLSSFKRGRPVKMSKGSDAYTITTITDNDVLMGRGNHIVVFPGNMKYREIVRKHRDEYVATKQKPIKGAIARRVVETVWAQGGRFLESDDNTRCEKWREAPLERVLDKTTQALREKRAWKEHRIG